MEKDKQEHLDRLTEIQKAMEIGIGRKIKAYALVIVDEANEVYWGGDFADEQTAALIAKRTLQVGGYAKDFAKKAA